MSSKKKKDISNRIGIFGGSFDPPHKGHRRAVEICIRHLRLDKVYVVPSYQTPNKKPAQASPQNRFQMAQSSFSNLPKVIVVDDEIKRQRTSYTIDTLNKFYVSGRITPLDDIFLIIGDDLFYDLIHWKNFSQLLKKTHWIVCVRSKKSTYNTPSFLKQYVQSSGALIKKEGDQKNLSHILRLNTNRNIYFLYMDQFENLSSKIIKKKIRTGIEFHEDIVQFALSDIKKNY